MERFFCKVCKTQPNKYGHYCSIKCADNDPEFHEICRTSDNKADAARKFGIPITTFKRMLDKLNIDIIKKEKVIPVKVCPKCNKEHTARYNIYCSKSCAASTRKLSEELKKKISENKKEFYKSEKAKETKRKMSESRKKFYESEEARKRQSENKKEFYKNNPRYEDEELKKKMSKIKKEYFENNPKAEETRKKLSENAKNYYEKHPEKILTPEQRKAADKTRRTIRRARKLNAFSPDADRKLLAKIQEYCPKGYHVDHIIPISKGGLEHQDNLQYLPASENIRKGARLDYVPQGVIRWQDVVPQ